MGKATRGPVMQNNPPSDEQPTQTAGAQRRFRSSSRSPLLPGKWVTSHRAFQRIWQKERTTASTRKTLCRSDAFTVDLGNLKLHS